MPKFRWNPRRPFAVLDTEATGTNTQTDRIVEISIVKVLPGGAQETHTFRINPGMAMPKDVIAIHGITDADVANSPLFAALAPRIEELLRDCDLGGFNLLRYDVPLLIAEFARAGLKFPIEGRRIVDAQRIFHRREPRDLTAALRFYCGEAHANAHGAEADAIATLRVIEGQFEKYADLPTDVDELDEYCAVRDIDCVDRAGRFKWVNDEVVINFGQKAGQPLRDLVARESGLLKWILRGEFPPDTKEVVQNALEGKYPMRAAAKRAPRGDSLGSIERD